MAKQVASSDDKSRRSEDSTHGDSNGGPGGGDERSVIEQTVAEDPLAKWLDEHWRQICVIGLVIALGFYVKNRFDQSYENSMKQAADLFSNVREKYDELVSVQEEIGRAQISKSEAVEKQDGESSEGSENSEEDGQATEENVTAKVDQKKLDELNKQLDEVTLRVSEQLRALEQEPEPYSQLAVLYRGLVALQLGDLTEAETRINSLDWRSQLGKEPAESLIGELGAISLGRMFVDNPEKREQGIEILRVLANKGSYVNVSAALTLARISQDDSEKAEALKLLEQIQSNQPEQNKFLEQDLQRLQG